MWSSEYGHIRCKQNMRVFKKIVYWYLKRKLKVCNHVISQSGNWFTVKMLRNTIQINYTNIFFRKLQGTEVAKKRWRKNIYPKNMIIFCNHRYSRSLKLSPYHNRAAQWSSMRYAFHIFFPTVFTRNLLIAYTWWHLIDNCRQIPIHHTKLCRNPVSFVLLFEMVISSPGPIR